MIGFAGTRSYDRDWIDRHNQRYPLKDSPVVQAEDPTTLLQIVIHGTRNVATDPAPTAPAMPAFGWRLSDEGIAAVLTYIRNSWGNAASPVVSGDAAKRRPQITEVTP